MTEQLLPTRQDHVSDDRDVVLDLDAINPKPIVITFRGNRYELKPIALGDFLSVYQAIERFKRDVDVKGDASAKEMTDNMIGAYVNLFKSVCPELNKDVVKTMSASQASLLLVKIVEMVQGSSEGPLKKNTLSG
jgi:hypothetical protein